MVLFWGFFLNTLGNVGQASFNCQEEHDTVIFFREKSVHTNEIFLPKFF